MEDESQMEGLMNDCSKTKLLGDLGLGMGTGMGMPLFEIGYLGMSGVLYVYIIVTTKKNKTCHIRISS